MIELKSKVGTRGQIVIPKPIRDMFQIHPEDHVTFTVRDNMITLCKEDGKIILDRILTRFEKDEVDIESIDWDELHYSQYGE